MPVDRKGPEAGCAAGRAARHAAALANWQPPRRAGTSGGRPSPCPQTPPTHIHTLTVVHQPQPPQPTLLVVDQALQLRGTPVLKEPAHSLG